mgnify:FL=1
MTWHLVTFANDKFLDKKKYLHEIHEEEFCHHAYNREWLETTDFYAQNKELLDAPIGAGWWAWKPYVIAQAMEHAADGDYILYCDCGDMFSPGLRLYVEQEMNETDDISMLLVSNNLNGQYTKRDCFVLMNCDEEDYWNERQLECGFMVWKVTDQTREVIAEWQKHCLDLRVIGNAPSTEGEELDGFVAHRNDQSILTNLAIRDGLTVGSPEFRNYIECDYDYWYERGGQGYGRQIDQFLIAIKENA